MALPGCPEDTSDCLPPAFKSFLSPIVLINDIIIDFHPPSELKMAVLTDVHPTHLLQASWMCGVRHREHCNGAATALAEVKSASQDSSSAKAKQTPVVSYSV